MAAKAVYAETFRVPDPRVFVRILTAMDIAYVDKVRAMNDRKELKK